MNRRLLAVLATSLACTNCGGGGGSSGSDTRWPANLTVSQTGWVTLGNRALASSTKLAVSWTAPAEPVDRYEVLAQDTVSGCSVTQTADGLVTETTLTGLRSGTTYELNLHAILKRDGATRCSADRTASAKTEEEYWQVQGTGNSVATATRTVEDGNVSPYAFRYGAGSDLEGRVRLYYSPFTNSEKGARVAINTPGSFLTFDRVPDAGVRAPQVDGSTPPPFGTFQAVPLADGRVRLLIELRGDDHKNRIVSIDSQDGWVGADFNPSSSPLSTYPDDFGQGGPCSFTTVLGVEGDAEAAMAGISNARQCKIGWPALDQWAWDGAPGTFLVITVDLADVSQSSSEFCAAYAVWNGTEWKLQYSEGTHPKIFSGVQAPLPVHLGGARYKMYFQHNTALKGSFLDWSTMTSTPTKVVYADGAQSGDASLVDFEDWDTIDSARRVHFLWPDGSEMDLATESKLDDFVFLMPTADPEFQMMYTNMSAEGTAPFIATAVLANP